MSLDQERAEKFIGRLARKGWDDPIPQEIHANLPKRRGSAKPIRQSLEGPLGEFEDLPSGPPSSGRAASKPLKGKLTNLEQTASEGETRRASSKPLSGELSDEELTPHERARRGRKK